ncbi:MAG: DUF2804 domain-containing protein [Candidatus Microbacterium phytovorans]|uniref:DUF2804 domain-containing protein n=1 Tax=Candidatus Microbacterium phytovorans TaxID=3121374 RepID=A0AAJ5VZB5_9MICO|nr:DUF2804 domain-containing protein [Microbacterium sp.]WEK12655.1 MAG: DUF2804 domain-containing protein [Microbacterium sp.]
MIGAPERTVCKDADDRDRRDVHAAAPRPRMIERELTQAVSLTTEDGSLNPAAVGFARRPFVTTAGIDGRHNWGRNKRWEYWNIITPTHVLALTVSSLDYAAVHEVWVLDRRSGRERGRTATVVPAHDVDLPPTLGGGAAIARAKDLAVSVTPGADAWRLFAEIPDVSFDVTVARPPDHDCLAVVVPWTRRRFQYTVKDVALPATGVVIVDGVEHAVPAGSWAVLDHGRGRWPYDVRWNWGAGSGVSDGRTIGLQVGGRWTDGTGSTENGILVDGVLHKISEDLAWDFDAADASRPWHVSGGGLDAALVPFYAKRSARRLGPLSSRTDQCFGVWSGTFEGMPFEGLVGFAEDVHNRW